MTDVLLADLREFVKRHASNEPMFGTLKSPTDADVLLERIEKRLSLPKLEDHEFYLELEQDEETPEKVVASLRVKELCDNNSCVCHVGNYSEWGIVYGEIPVKVQIEGGKRCSWSGEYDDTYIKVSERIVPSPCKLGDLPRVDLNDMGPRIVPCSTEGT